jgi:hypothetical protein
VVSHLWFLAAFATYPTMHISTFWLVNLITEKFNTVRGEGEREIAEGDSGGGAGEGEGRRAERGGERREGKGEGVIPMVWKNEETESFMFFPSICKFGQGMLFPNLT